MIDGSRGGADQVLGVPRGKSQAAEVFRKVSFNGKGATTSFQSINVSRVQPQAVSSEHVGSHVARG